MESQGSAGFTIISNKKVFIFFRWLAAIFAALVLIDLIFSVLPGSLADISKGHIMAFTGGIGLGILFILPVNYFHYDDSYEILHLRSKSLWSLGTDLHKRFDFPKRKVTDYQIKGGGPFKSLWLTLDNYASDSQKVRKLGIFMITEEQLAALIDSLERMKARNKANLSHD